MKILLACVHFHSSFGWSIERAFQRANHEVRVFDYRWPQSKRRMWSGVWRRRLMPAELLRVAREYRPDLLFIAKGDAIPPEIVRDIRSETRCRIVNWFPDARLFSYENVVRALPSTDLLFTKSHLDLARMKSLGMNNGRFLLHCADHELHLSPEDRPQIQPCEVALVGSYYPYRDLVVAHLGEFDLKVWGPGWERSELYRKRRETVMLCDARSFEQAWVFRKAIVSLNPHHYDDDGMNQRTFDIAGSGGCQLVDRRPDVESFFADGSELATYASVGEMVEKARWLVRNPDRAKEIGKRAAAKVAAGHTYDDRIEEILKSLAAPIPYPTGPHRTQ